MQVHDTHLSTVARSARELLAVYLAHYPTESSRFDQLVEHLEDDAIPALFRSNMRGHITTSMIVIDPATRKVLLIGHGISKTHLPPGGHYERDYSLWLSGAREALEETGVIVNEVDWCGPCSAPMPIDIDTHPIPANASKHEGEHFHHDYTFVGTASSAAPLIPQMEEVYEAKWADLAELHQSPAERVRRIAAKLEAAFPV